MEDMVFKKLENIETLLKLLNSKIDNFLGFENLSRTEKKEVELIRSEIKEGTFDNFEDVFE